MATSAYRSLGLALFSSLAVLACNETTGNSGTEDKDGVNEVPSPNGTSVGPGGLGGGGTGGAGGGVNGQPCQTTQDCDDGNPCTTENCVSMKCEQVNAADDGNACTTDTCDPMTGDITNVPVMVNDNDPCTYDTCDPATGAKNQVFVPFFADDFDNNAAGWALGPQWAIGSAASSMGAANGGDDPASNHSMTGDGVAGTALGAVIAAQAAPSYLTSPVIDLSSVDTATDKVQLRFWRWLNAEAPPEMTAFVEVQVGAATTQVWTNETAGQLIIDSPPLGTGWFQMRLDISAEANAAKTMGQPLRVRFGFTKGAAVPSIGGWNIDDVEVGRSLVLADGDLCTLDNCIDNGGAPAADHPMIPTIDDGNDMTTFVCVPGVGPQQQ